MSQKELVFYLENLRNLEILKYRAIQQMKLCDDRIAEKREIIRKKRYGFETSTIVSLIISIVLICAAIGVRYYSFVYSQGSYDPFVFFCLKKMLPSMLIIFAIVIPFTCGAVSDFFETIRYRIEATIHNRNVKRIKEQTIKEIECIENQKEQIRAEAMEIDRLLLEAYSFNIIPMQFRELSYIIYICDYVSSSQQSLENALLHSHMEKIVKQITAKMDVIVAQNTKAIRLLKDNLLATHTNTLQLMDLTNNVKLNNYLVRVNGYYIRSQLV